VSPAAAKGGSKGSPGLPLPPGLGLRGGGVLSISLAAVKPYESSSDEGSQGLSDDDSEQDANYEEHQQLMGYTTAESHTG